MSLSQEYLNDVLFKSAKQGDLHSLKRALKGGADLDYRDLLDETPLICAAKRGHLSAVEFLLEAGADVNAKSRLAARSMTALFWAVENGFEEIVRLLIKSGADVTSRNSENRTAYDLAVVQNHRTIAELFGSSPKS